MNWLNEQIAEERLKNRFKNSNMNWIDEKTCAERLRRKPRTLRRLVKDGKLPLEFTNVNGRTFFYSERSIEKVLLKNSSVINKT